MVDTNVLLVSVCDAESPHSAYRDVCVAFLRKVEQDHTIALDNVYILEGQYRKGLNRAKKDLGRGILFAEKWLNRMIRSGKIDLISIDDPSTYEVTWPSDLLAVVHRKDRAFVEVSRSHHEHPPIAFCIERGWNKAEAALETHGIQVRQICI